MTNYETKIIIEASVVKVWEVLNDFQNYANWNPFITSIKSIKNKDKLMITLKPGDKKEMQISPTLLVNDKNRELRWLGHLFVPGLFDGEHYFILEVLANNQSLLTHGENFKGLLAKPLLKMVGADTLDGFKAMNEALKKHIEQSVNLTV